MLMYCTNSTLPQFLCIAQMVITHKSKYTQRVAKWSFFQIQQQRRTFRLKKFQIFKIQYFKQHELFDIFLMTSFYTLEKI
jgi:hypothetical protein